MSQSYLPMALITIRSDETLETLFKKAVGKSLTLSPSLYLSPLPFFQSLFLSRRPPIKHWWSGKWGRPHCLAITLGIGFLSDRSAGAWQRHILCVLTIYVRVYMDLAKVWRQICPKKLTKSDKISLWRQQVTSTLGKNYTLKFTN